MFLEPTPLIFSELLTFAALHDTITRMVPYKDIFKALNKAHVRYLVAGGISVNLHQIVRATMDLDLIVHLERDNVLKFIGALKRLGFVPRVPVKPEELADEEIRESWVKKKKMVVFTFINPKNPMEQIDVFVREPRPFRELNRRRKSVKAFGTTIPVVGLEDLIAMKKDAGRPKDLYDVDLLKKK